MLGKSRLALFFYHKHSLSAIGVQEESHDTCKCIIELTAIHWVAELLTLGTRGMAAFQTACPYLAPGCLGVFSATLALVFQETLACSAVKPSHRDKVLISFYVLHNVTVYLFIIILSQKISFTNLEDCQGSMMNYWLTNGYTYNMKGFGKGTPGGPSAK